MSIPLDRHPDTWEHLVEQMIEALREAMNDASRNKRRSVAVQGKQHTHSGGSYYTFTLEDDWEPSANTSVQIAIDSDDSGKMIAGTILSSTNNQVTLVTEIPLPQASLKKVTLCEATAWLLEKLCDALIRLQRQDEASIDMAAKTFGLFPSYVGRDKRQVSMSSFMSDSDQERAITLGMESERLFLIGPPGTGKTSTEAALALEFLHSHKTVLLVAHTNVALDTAIKRLQQYCEQSGNTHHLKQHHICECYHESGSPQHLGNNACL